VRFWARAEGSPDLCRVLPAGKRSGCENGQVEGDGEAGATDRLHISRRGTQGRGGLFRFWGTAIEALARRSGSVQ